MQKLLLGMGSDFYSYQQNSLWDEFIQAISISKELSVVYVSSVKDHKSDSKELLNAFKKSNEKTHVALETFLNSFIAQEYDDVHNTASDIGTCHDQTQVSPGLPRYQSRSRSQDHMASSEAELRSDTRIQYSSKTEFQPQDKNLNKSPSNSHIPTQSKNVYWSSSNLSNPTQYEVRNKSRSKSQDPHEFDTRSMYSSVTGHRPRSRNLNRSPSNYRIQTQHVRRNRSRSRSHNEQTFDSRSTYSSKNRQRSRSRIRKKSQSKSLDRRDNVTEHLSLSKSKNHHPSRSSKNYKFKSRTRQKHPKYKPKYKSKHPFKKWKKFKSTQLTESTSSSSGTSQLDEEPPIPVVNSGTTTLPPPQDACQVPRPFYSHNVTPMYYAQPTHMPRLMPLPYYVPSRPRLQYPPTYPRILYRPHWQPTVLNFDTQ